MSKSWMKNSLQPSKPKNKVQALQTNIKDFDESLIRVYIHYRI